MGAQFAQLNLNLRRMIGMSKNNIGGCKAAEKNRVQVTTKQQEK